MSTITIDTYNIVKKLTEKGYSTIQAEGFVAAIEGINFDDLASKRDLKDLERSLHSDMREMELRLTIKMGGLTFLLGGFLTAIKFFG